MTPPTVSNQCVFTIIYIESRNANAAPNVSQTGINGTFTGNLQLTWRSGEYLQQRDGECGTEIK